VTVRHLRDRERFAPEAVDVPRLEREPRPQHLEGHQPVELGVAREPDERHPAPASCSRSSGSKRTRSA
jgi:hypothetical protein